MCKTIDTTFEPGACSRSGLSALPVIKSNIAIASSGKKGKRRAVAPLIKETQIQWFTVPTAANSAVDWAIFQTYPGKSRGIVIALDQVRDTKTPDP
jgi:hypothetical protein